MNNYYLNIAGDMFDFKDYYDKIALELPDECRIVEVGTANGRSMIYLAERLHELGKLFKLYAVDNLDYGKMDQLATIVNHITKCGVGEFIEFMPMSSLDAASKFNDNYFDFVFLDSSHAELQTISEIVLWHRKVKHHGILAGHDYTLYEGVRNAVDLLIPKTNIHTEEYGVFKSVEIYKTEKGYDVWEVRKSWQALVKPA